MQDTPQRQRWALGRALDLVLRGTEQQCVLVLDYSCRPDVTYSFGREITVYGVEEGVKQVVELMSPRLDITICKLNLTLRKGASMLPVRYPAV